MQILATPTIVQRLSSLARALADSGVKEGMDPRLKRRILNLNKVSITIALITIPYVFVFAAAGAWHLGLLVVPIVLGYLLVVLLNRVGLHRFSGITMLLTGCLAVTSYSLACGEAAGIHHYYFALAVFPAFAFDSERMKPLILASLLPLLLFAAVELWGFQGVPWVNLDPMVAHSVYLSIAFSTFATIVAASLYLHRSSEKTEIHFRTIFENANDTIYMLDREKRFVTINRGARGDVDPRRIVGKTIFELLGRDEAERYSELYDSVFRGGKPRQIDESYTDRNGNTIWHSLRLSPVLSADGAVVNVICISRETTAERKMLEELKAAKDRAEEASAAKSAFLATMSHEIRTPMGVILGFLELISETVAQEQKTLFSAIERNGKHLLKLIDEILDLSKIESGQLRMEPVPVYARTEIAGVVELLRSRATAKGLVFQATYADDLPESIVTDPVRFRQVLVNVIDNAIKFTDHGGVTIRSFMKPGRLCVEVTDTGIGISAEAVGGLFKPFSQADTSISRRFGGTGLGLDISRRFARALGGDVRLESSRPGSGSTFVIEINPGLPGRAATGKAPSDAKDDLKQNAKSLAGRRILVVEDTPDNQFLLRRILEAAGCEVALAEDGQEGIAKALSGDVAAVLMDIQLPGINGYAAAAQLREKGVRTPIIAVTAHATTEERDRCLKAGCNDYLTKPVNRGALLECLARWA